MWTTTILSLAAICGLATARISGIAAPAVIAPNSTFTITILTENYIQSVKDISAAFALSPIATDGYLGVDYLGSFYLGPDKSNILTNLTFEVTAPATANAKFLTAAINSLYGASNSPVTETFSVPVSIGEETSGELNSSRDRSNICSSGVVSRSPTAEPSTDPSCTFPTETTNLIQLSLVRAEALINSIVQNNNQTGRQNLGELNGVLGDVTRAVVPNGQSCNNAPTGPWPPLSPTDSQNRAIAILRDAENGLNELQQDVIECDKAAAVSSVCRVLHLVDYLDTYYT
jgi:hypothetical protein